ncbi:MAG: hypothetical protein Q8L77_12485 [Nitrospirota bacterium]|nr:hypothetical protein [Nitrospirota bacterium]
MFLIIFISLIVTLFPEQSFLADSDAIRYQRRVNYYEGIKGRLVSGELIELVSVKALTAENQPADGPDYKLAFVAQGGTAPHITVRELQFHYGYWLDNVEALQFSKWEQGKAYEFSWPKQYVISQKNIRLQDLGAVVRLDSQPGAIERVLPAVLYDSKLPPAVIQSYAFTFKTLHDTQLTCTLAPKSPGTSAVAITQPRCGLTRGKQSQTIVWEPGKADLGWYTLRIEGFQLADNERLEQLVHFVHAQPFPSNLIPVH